MRSGQWLKALAESRRDRSPPPVPATRRLRCARAGRIGETVVRRSQAPTYTVSEGILQHVSSRLCRSRAQDYRPAGRHKLAMWATVAAAAARATWLDWAALCGVLLGALYYWGTRNYDFFERVPGGPLPALRPRLPFAGSFWPMFLGTEPMPDLVKRLYDSGAGHRAVGLFDFRRPMYMIRDPALLKQVTVKDFDHFVNHQKPVVKDMDPRWREMRATLSPAFTSSKLKGMFGLIQTCARQLAQHVSGQHTQGGKDVLELDIKDLYTRFTNDIIATTAFGLSVDSLKNPKNEFYMMGMETTTPSLKQILVVIGFLLFPKLTKALGGRLMPKKNIDFFDSLVHDTIRERREKGIFRPDMLQLLMQAQAGQLKAESEEEKQNEERTTKYKLEDVDITAQALVFFFAGFETSATALCFITYAIATHPEVQKRLQNEVDEAMMHTNGDLTYETVQGMKYLDMVVSEALRLYPPGIATDRQCSGDITIPANNGEPALHFKDDDVLWIPVCGIHRDPQYWHDPEKFDPERFSDENKQNIKPFTYMPFGFGPRICIGQRFALLEVKLALIYMVANFELSREDGNDGTIKYAKGMRLLPVSGHKTFFKPRAK
ncbi:Probable cytochrome P450 6t1 [Gryllus bimaculatus]|nr:Probable cytochrome P450 6t1 [Gryllus bimaculatus]